MSKLRHMDVASAKAFVEGADQRIFDSVRDSMTVGPAAPLDQKLLRTRYYKFLAIIVFISGLVFIFCGFFFGDKSYIDFGGKLALLVLGMLMCLAGILLYFYFRILSIIRRKDRARVNFDQVGVYQRFFDTYFDNFEVSRFATRAEVVDFASLRPASVPTDANISIQIPGAVGTINDMPYFSAWTQWHWTRTYYIGRSRYEKDYFYQVFNLKVLGAAECFQNFDLQMHMPKLSLLNFGKSNLESAAFNKMVSIKSNDQVALRRLLTPFTQEQLLSVNHEDSRNLEVFLSGNTFTMMAHEPSTLFNIDFDFSMDRDALVNSIVKDFKKDITIFIALMSKITAFKTLKTG